MSVGWTSGGIRREGEGEFIVRDDIKEVGVYWCGVGKF